MKRPRIRLWMLLVLVVVVAVPVAIVAEKRRRDRLLVLKQQSSAYHQKALSYTKIEQILREQVDQSLSMAESTAKTVEFMREIGKPYKPPGLDESGYRAEAAKYLKSAESYANLARKYEQAAFHPERPVAPDPPLDDPF